MTPHPTGPRRATVHRAADRYTIEDGEARLTSHHSFSFTGYYDPDNTHHGSLLSHAEHLVRPGGGFDTHRHRDMEIVTWVLAGVLEHRDDSGERRLVGPGRVQRLSAGAGVRHSERNASATEPLRFVQMWLAPERAGTPPAYELGPLPPDGPAGAVVASGAGLVPLASGMPQHAGGGAVRLGRRDAALHLGRPAADGPALLLPDAPYLHVFVTRGAVEVWLPGEEAVAGEAVGDAGVEAGVQDAGLVASEGSGAADVSEALSGVSGGRLRLAAGDALRLTGRAPGAVVRTTAREPVELLVWEMHGTL
ncbi:pirin family protein [Allostreptomyces psammosilenae]|uniref:Pirin N-terminal domain-containing protein n=1 Tax=Allostreptomyces psammosilenae TaxID=1892865 RepID=A0A852ZLB4_9ACTN|nr:pirin family protein [Allostreptomyces psammosilenae]NYI03193.1 hypothetical protein [Allostreptomyces psammosilenae]